MKPQAAARWEKTRAMGKRRYVLISGVLSYGLPMFVAMTFFVHRSDLSPNFIAVSAVLWLTGGALFGLVTWHIFERQFAKAKARLGA